MDKSTGIALERLAMNSYEELAKKLSFPECLKGHVNLIFDITEVKILLEITESMKTPKGISEAIGFEVDETEKILNSLFFRGYVDREKRNETYYYKTEEFKVILYQFIHEKFDRLTSKQRKPFQEAFMDRYLRMFETSLHPVFKVVPTEAALEKSLPHMIIPYTRASEILAQAKKVIVIDCICRKTMRRFDKLWNVCLILGDNAEFYRKRNLSRELTQKEAQEVLKRASEDGLVHTIDNPAMRYPTHVICNCDDKACAFIRGLKEFDNEKALTYSGYVSITNFDSCKQCGKCIDVCIFNARKLENKRLQFVENKCFGCGLCILACPEKAIDIKPNPRLISKLA